MLDKYTISHGSYIENVHFFSKKKLPQKNLAHLSTFEA